MTKRARKNLARNIPLSLDKDLLAEIDAIAGDKDENRSLVMRKAIQQGLPLVKAGGNADVITLDSEISAEIDQVGKETKLKRNKILVESIRVGFQAFASRVMSEKMSLANVQDPEQIDYLRQHLEESYKIYDDPMVLEHRKLIMERGDAMTLLKDILYHIPEAKRRHDLVKRLTELRSAPDGSGGGRMWGRGLTTQEIAWQVSMHEKYGMNAALWPKEEIEAREAARKIEPEK